MPDGRVPGGGDFGGIGETLGGPGGADKRWGGGEGSVPLQRYSMCTVCLLSGTNKELKYLFSKKNFVKIK
jgi:hypothetical protein